MLLQSIEECHGPLLAGVARPCDGEARLYRLQHSLLRILVFLRRLAEEERARLRAVVAPVAAGDLEERSLALLEGPVIPGEVGGRGVDARRQHGHDGRIVTPVAARTLDAGVVDLGCHVILLHAGLDQLHDAGMHGFDDAGGTPHELDLGRGLDEPLPVDEPRHILEDRVRQVLLQCRMGRSREIIIVELHADLLFAPTLLLDDPGEMIHGVAFGGLNEMIRVADDVVVVHEDRALGAIRVKAAAPPDRLAFEAEQHGLVHIERPAIIAGEPGHVGGIRDQQHLDALLLHGLPGLGDAGRVLVPREMQRGRRHGAPSDGWSGQGPTLTETGEARHVRAERE